jgi:hypothetical protein
VTSCAVRPDRQCRHVTRNFPSPDGARHMKVVVAAVALLFVGYWMVQEPQQLADVTQDSASWLWDGTQTVMTSVIDFLGALFE